MNKLRISLVALLAAGTCARVPTRSIVGGAPVVPEALALDDDTVVGPRHFTRAYPSEDAGGVNAVIEIPAGTTAKFEVDEADGWLHWQRDREHGGRREIDYLPFPVNYGVVPRTRADDGDGLDILVLGRGFERGHVAKTRIIGVLEMGEDDERDDKVVAVPIEPALENGFSALHDLAELDARYPAVRAILERWFAGYWGEGATRVRGWGGPGEARAILERAKRAHASRIAGAQWPTRRSSSSSSTAMAIARARSCTTVASAPETTRLSMLSAITRMRTSPPSPAASTALRASTAAASASPSFHAQYASPSARRNITNGTGDSGIAR